MVSIQHPAYTAGQSHAKRGGEESKLGAPLDNLEEAEWEWKSWAHS